MKQFISERQSLLKTIYTLSFVCFISLLNAQSTSSPNSDEIIFSDWKLSGENAAHVAVSYRTVRCDSVNQLQLKLVNNNSTDQNLTFHIDITNNATGDHFNKDISIALLMLQQMAGDCLDTNAFGLRLDLPILYNPTDLNVAVSF